MSTDTIEANPNHVSDYDIQALKDKLTNLQRAKEHQKLTSEINDIVYKQNIHAGNSTMNVGDTDQILASNYNENRGFVTRAFDRFIAMLSPAPMSGYIISLVIILSVYSAFHSHLFNSIGGHDISKYMPYFGYTALISAAIIVFRSSARGLFLAMLTFLFGLIGALSTESGQTFLSFEHVVFQIALAIGGLSLLRGALNIDAPRNNAQ